MSSYKHQLVDYEHQLVDYEHQLVDYEHQLVDYEHQLVDYEHQLLDYDLQHFLTCMSHVYLMKDFKEKVDIISRCEPSVSHQI